MNVKAVFLSSTANDLTAYRKAAGDAVNKLDGYQCIRMEDFGARNAMADDFCQAKAKECDVFVGILGHCYGSSPKGSDKSYTEQEYDAAIATGKPRLMFLAPEDFPLPAHLVEPDERRKKQRAFRGRVNTEQIRDTFSTPDDLTWRVVQAVHNWEQQQAAVDQRPAPARAEGIIPLPPQPYFARPYPLQQNFTGRAAWRKMLTAWLASEDRPVFALVAIGGMGKSALTWAWLQRDVLGLPLPGQAPDDPEAAAACRVPEASRPEGVLWWSFYEQEAGFEGFLNRALSYAGGGKLDLAAIPSAYDKAAALVELLRQRRLLLVLDGLERELRAYASLSAAYQGDAVAEDERGDFRACTDPHAGTLLSWLAAGPLRGRVLLTSRLFPRELDDLAGCRHEELRALDPEDAVTFFHAQGVKKGTRAEIQAACAPYGYHPMALRLLSGMIVRDPARPGDIAAAEGYSPITDLKPREHHILALAYDALRPPLREFLSRLAAFRSPLEYAAAKALSVFDSENELKAGIRELMDRGLLLLDRQRERYDLHPIVRKYAYDRLTDKTGVHARLCDYFAAVPKPDADRVQAVEDLAPVIELYHHMLGTGRYDEACDLFRDRPGKALYYRFGAYHACIELLRGLFPDGEGRPPRLKQEADQAWTLNALAVSYARSGQSRHAVPLRRMSNDLYENRRDKAAVAITLGNLADDQVRLGELAAAEQSLGRRIELCREVKDDFNEAIGHQELGRVLACQGAFADAGQELDAALGMLEGEQQLQFQCLAWAYRAVRAMLMGDAGAASGAARRARELADEVARSRYPHERDIIQAEWLLGAALLAQAAEAKGQPGKAVADAEAHLTEALNRCRRINMVDHEPDILLAWARWHRANGDGDLAHKVAGEALAIADRCEYRLKQADIHNFLARLALDAGDRPAAGEHARMGYERAWCDGPPHCYKPALEEAARLLGELGEPLPALSKAASL
jgi:tetratricopeptide (TPR) repeat protein